MLLESDIKEVGKISYRSEKLIEEISNYDWKNTYDAYLGNTGAIVFPFRNGRCDSFLKSEDVSQKELLIISLCIPLLREINLYFPNYKFIKGEMYCCFRKSEQKPHVDPKVFHRFCHRIHIPLTSNNESFLQVEDNHYHLEPYTIYDFNNLKRHRSYNNGDSNRIHIVVDIMEESIFNRFKEKETYMELFEKSDHDGSNLEEYLDQLTKV